MRDIINTLKGIFLGLIVVAAGVGIFTYAAWNAPNCAPPGCNVSAPLNISNSDQIKAGKLGVNGPSEILGALDVNGRITVRGGSPGDGKVLTSDANGTSRWSYIADQNSACEWYYPPAECTAGSRRQGRICPDGQYAAGARSGFKRCKDVPGAIAGDDIEYTAVYCCPILH